MNRTLPHALVIDDNADAAESLALLIEMEGFTVAMAGTLQDARRQLELQPPQIVFLDLMLPDGNGMDLLEQTRLLPNVQVVMLSGTGAFDLSAQAKALGATAYLVKPADMNQLIALLERVKAARQAGMG